MALHLKLKARQTLCLALPGREREPITLRLTRVGHTAIELAITTHGQAVVMVDTDPRPRLIDTLDDTDVTPL